MASCRAVPVDSGVGRKNLPGGISIVTITIMSEGFPCFNNISFDFAMKPANPRKLGLLKLIFIYARSAAHCTIDFGTAYSLEAFRIDKSQR